MNSLSFEQGEIITAPILFSSQIGAKPRPALILSSKRYNQASDDIVVLKITSKGKDYPFDVQLTDKDMAEGELKYESVIQADFPVVIEKQIIMQKIGKIKEQKLGEVKQKLKELFNL